MAMKTAALLLSSLVIASEAQTHPPGANEAMHKAAGVTPMKDEVNLKIYCPKDTCLRRVAKGATAKSFHCMRHAGYNGHICAGENGVCNCPNGKIIFGNFASATKPNKWTQPIMGGTAPKTCNIATFGGDPIPGGAKVCHCTPHGVWYVPVNKTEAKAECGKTPRAGWEVPKCIEAHVKINSGMPWTSVWGLGLNLATVNILVGMSFNTHFGYTTCHVPYYNKEQVLSAVQCNVTGPYGTDWSGGLLQKFDNVQASVASLQTSKDNYITANAAILGPLAGMKALVNFEMVPNITNMPDAPANCVIQVPDPYPAVGGAVKTGLAMISAPIMLAAAAWFQ